MSGEAAWPVPTEAALRPVLDRLTALGTTWASGRGSAWHIVLNSGPIPAGGPHHRFRWQVVIEAVRFAAGRALVPPEAYGALPLGLQGFLSWAIPAALAGPQDVAPDLARSRAAVHEADRLAAELTGPHVSESPSDLPDDRPVPATAESNEDPSALLNAALAATGPADLPQGAHPLLARLRAGPVPLAELRGIASAHGLLPGTLLDAVDAAAVRATGSRATRVEGHTVCFSVEYLAAVARGEDPFA